MAGWPRPMHRSVFLALVAGAGLPALAVELPVVILAPSNAAPGSGPHTATVRDPVSRYLAA